MIQAGTVPRSPHEVKCSAATLADNSASNLQPFFSRRWMRFKVTRSQMEFAMRIMRAASLVAVCGILACAPARADTLPPFQGNDTGGIIPYPLAAQMDVRQRAVDHCAYYGQVVEFLAVDPQYGRRPSVSRHPAL